MLCFHSGQAVALIFFALGLGTLLPWNFFITATQYFNERLAVLNITSNGTSGGGTTTDYNFDSWMALLSQLPLLLFTLLNSFLFKPLNLNELLMVDGDLITIFIIFALTAALVSVPMQPDTFFSVTMTSIWFINSDAVLQGSLFGVVGLFPHRYNTLFMSGQGLAGIFAAVAMLSSILCDAEKSLAALGYFITPCVATLGTLLCYLLLPHLIWLMALCVTCVFAVTVSVFPVVTVRVQTVYKDNAAWDKVFTCTCCFIVFNAMDLAGRGTPSLVQWPSKGSLLFPATVVSRLVFVPLLMMCNVENSRLTVLFSHDAAFVAIMALFSFSNGYLATLCMAYAPQLVHRQDGETVGSLMTFFLVLGLALGASLSFLLGKLV
uniref:Equilibrative nucleoside transporter 2-like n=1 Tax=Scophthalmus maximus TaxID=52904 RepID=A0A8D3BHV2_SCOMX